MSDKAINEKNEFHTFKGYELAKVEELSASTEDYLEMICRMLKTHEVVRVNLLADNLNVKPSSASKMVANLRRLGLVSFEPYGYITPTNEGLRLGEYLLRRHDVLCEFLCLINGSQNETEQVEKIEHFINEQTVENIRRATEILKSSARFGEP